MKLKEMFHQLKTKTNSAWNTFKNYESINKVITIWKTGKIQKTSRITYDVVWNIILFFLIIGFIGAFFVGGLGAGYFASLVKDESIRSYEDMKKDIYNYEETSKLYFANNVYIGDVRAELYREETTLDKISPTLVQAVIATEDEYFEEHQGIVPKAIFRALYQEVSNASMQSGGSTLTQQLIKNQILTNEVSFERKAKEMLLALRLERLFEKDEILEAYLNIVPYGRNSSGGNIAGIQTAAQGIFGINADEVNLAQAAYLAGLPQSPSYYTPFKNSGGLKEEEGINPGLNRMKIVLNRMLDMEYITNEEYEEAINYDIVADFKEEEKSPHEKYPILTREIQSRATDIIMYHLAEKDGYSKKDLEKDDKKLEKEYKELAARAIQSDGYKIHSTIDKGIYDAFQEVAANYQYYGDDRYTTVDGKKILQSIQAAAVLFDNKSGRIISFLGNRDYSEDNQTNYATSKRQIGSTSKPTVVYGPALEFGVVQPSTTIVDEPRSWGKYSPKNYGGGNYGTVTVRKALASSYNIPAVITYDKILSKDPASYLEKMGVTSLVEEDHYNLSFALGASKYGVPVEENINAYTTFGNNGKFADGYMIEKITTADGDLVYEHETELVDVFSPQTTYLTLDMMRDVLSSGTGTYVKSRLKYGGVDWAGKTGTSQDYKDAWFIATNPNVTFGTWLGYEYPASIYSSSTSLSYSQRTQNLWAQLINAASDINPVLIAPSEKFKQPDGIVSRSYCSISGNLASDLCQKAGLVKSDIYNSQYVPTKVDDSLIAGSQIVLGGKAVAAGSNTPQEFVLGNGLMFNPEWLERNGIKSVSKLIPRNETDKWQRIGAPRGQIASYKIENDGKAPVAPTSVNYSDNKLKWSRPDSGDIVGYRVYRKSKPDGNFELVGNTSSTEFSVETDDGTYQVKAVDYFGLESEPSNEVVIGKTSESTEETKPEKVKEDKEQKKKEKQE
ncbi:transglycosylase domain-containing protein [Oceanobacillus sp. Castelsardo]|uniref:transglycosylase domain-containing protein n=1 Tax=Oceanobacillus sp. Castelsardo TaxID=1851204 RepID=UPI000838EB2B|nr:transglycosylase domain-containing protein [Oceanobacillus sp. Castelsardo]